MPPSPLAASWECPLCGHAFHYAADEEGAAGWRIFVDRCACAGTAGTASLVCFFNGELVALAEDSTDLDELRENVEASVGSLAGASDIEPLPLPPEQIIEHIVEWARANPER